MQNWCKSWQCTAIRNPVVKSQDTFLDLVNLTNYIECSRNQPVFHHYFHSQNEIDNTQKHFLMTIVTADFWCRLLSAAFWKIITALRSHMSFYYLNLNSWQNSSWDWLTVSYCSRSLSNNLKVVYSCLVSKIGKKMNLGSK